MHTFTDEQREYKIPLTHLSVVGGGINGEMFYQHRLLSKWQ